MPHTVLPPTNRGITLLEVLISIGILAIGLMGTLALIPAGGSYLRKAQKESRAAALIPNAFDVMKTSNLFGENAIQWLIHTRTHDEVEDSLNGYPGTRKGTSYQNLYIHMELYHLLVVQFQDLFHQFYLPKLDEQLLLDSYILPVILMILKQLIL